MRQATGLHFVDEIAAPKILAVDDFCNIWGGGGGRELPISKKCGWLIFHVSM